MPAISPQRGSVFNPIFRQLLKLICIPKKGSNSLLLYVWIGSIWAELKWSEYQHYITDIFFRKYAPHLAFYGSQIQNLFSTEFFTPRRPVKSAIVRRCETVLI